jgi:hypothetical protein
MRIGLFSDVEGDSTALEAVLRALKQHAPDVVVCAGDILASPCSPDPPSETVAQLKAHGCERYLKNLRSTTGGSTSATRETTLRGMSSGMPPNFRRGRGNPWR